MSGEPSTEVQLRTLLSHLEKLNVNEPGRVLSIAERVLAIDPEHAFATHCKGVAQLQMGKVDAAKTTLERAAAFHRAARPGKASGAALNDELTFHLACAEYRQNRFQEAYDLLEALRSNPSSQFHLPARHLSAQCHYNMESYVEAAKSYQTMLQEGAFRDEQDRLEIITNLCACYAGCEPSKVAEVVASADEKTPDLLYNAATAMIESNNLAKAATLLAAAEAATRREHNLDAQQASDRDLDNKAFFDDMAAILVQRAYIAFVEGNEAEAEAVLKRVLDRKPTSISTYAVACVNWAAIKRHRDFFETHRRLKHAQTPQVSQRLTKKQRLYVAYNNALLLLHTGRLQPCGVIVDRILRDAPDSTLGPLAKAALLLKEKGAVRAETYLKAFLQERQAHAPRTDPSYSQLLLAQLWLEQGNLATALKYLADASAIVEGNAAAIATLATGYAECNDTDAARALLTKHIAAKKIAGIERFAAAFFLRHGLLSEAAEAYRALIKNTRGAPDPELLAGLAVSVSAACPEEGHSMAREQLLSAEDRAIVSSAQMEAERNPLPRAAIEEKGYKRRMEAEAEGRPVGKKKRDRPLRRPPAVKPSGPPDPERWVPLSMRPSMKTLPPRRIREMKRLRAADQEAKRKVHLKRQQQQQQEGATPATAAAVGSETS